MTIQASWLALVAGLIMLTLGGEFLVSGAVKLARGGRIWGQACVIALV